jgi:predicted DNA-binding antitoxin AbrB/MazE fold protein
MTITVEATYENGVLKPAGPLPLQEHEKVLVSVSTPTVVQKVLQGVQRSYGLIQWTGRPEDLDYLISDPENDPLEGA